jgi:hypothetical protein
VHSDVVIALRERVAAVRDHGAYHRLVLLVGPSRSGKTQVLRELAADVGWARVNLNVELAERLLDVPARFRQIRVLELLRDIAAAFPGDGIVLDNIELLFQRSLHVDPLQALLTLSRSRVIVAAWCGGYSDAALTYAAPGHAEYRHYPDPGCSIVPVSVQPGRLRPPKASRA